jgi:transcriptional regulator with XRE-family HTH domain
MKANNQFREKILNHSAYWVEGINGLLYDAIVTYMEKHNLKRKYLANHLDISTGRVSQILNEGNINFSLEKIIEIAIKVDKFPVFEFEDKSTFLEKEKQLADEKRLPKAYEISETQSDFILNDVSPKLKTQSKTNISKKKS